MSFDLTTFLFELVNFVVLVAVLGRFVYRPIARGLTERRDELTSTRKDAADKLAMVEARQVELDARSVELDRLRERVFSEATAEAAAERERLMAVARDDAKAERAKGQSTLEAEREAALGWVRHEAIHRGAEVAGALLLELAPEAAQHALVVRVAAAVAERAGALEQAIVDGRLRAEVTWAQHPTEDDRNMLTQALAQLGAQVDLTEREDEELGAGVVVRVGDRVLDASIAGQLTLLRQAAEARLDDTGTPA